MLDLMIFSKNRALQLYALLESIEKYTNPRDVTVNVLHKYEGVHAETLAEIKQRFQSCNFIEEINFKEHVEEFLSAPGTVAAFLTDDIILKEHVDILQIEQIMLSNPGTLGFSLRLGLHVYDCYALNKEQPVPLGNVYPPNLFVWNWRDAKMDWEYVFSVDGHIFRKGHLREWSSLIDYHHPNSYEESLQACRGIRELPQSMVCFVTSRLVNLPINRVQDSHQNRCGDIDSSYLLEKWNAGLCLDIDRYHRVLNKGVHSELELFFKER